MKIIDISWPITNNITAYKDQSVVKIESVKNFEVDGVRESRFVLGSHSGTHVDAPSHFLRDGYSLDKISLNNLCGDCILLDLTDVLDFIKVQDLKKFEFKIRKNLIVLLKTQNSLKNGEQDKFDYNFIYLDHLAAKYLVDLEVKAVGIDYLGIERNDKEHKTHTVLLKSNIPIIEGLRLADASDICNYKIICLPINIIGVEAAPARVILIEQQD